MTNVVVPNHTGATLAGSAITISASDSQVVPSDGSNVCNGVYVGTGGTVVIVDEHGNQSTWSNVPNAFIIPVRVSKVLATGTTASGFVALY